MAKTKYIPAIGPLDGAVRMLQAFCLQISIACVFWVRKLSEIHLLSCGFQFGLPFVRLLIPMYAKKPAFVVNLSSLPVLFILSIRCIAQIVEFVICTVSVFMIYLIFWPFAGHVKPCKSMGVKLLFVDADNNVSTSDVKTSKFATHGSAIKSRSGGGQLPKNTSFIIVVAKFAQSFGRKNWLVCHG